MFHDILTLLSASHFPFSLYIKCTINRTHSMSFHPLNGCYDGLGIEEVSFSTIKAFLFSFLILSSFSLKSVVMASHSAAVFIPTVIQEQSTG